MAGRPPLHRAWRKARAKPGRGCAQPPMSLLPLVSRLGQSMASGCPSLRRADIGQRTPICAQIVYNHEAIGYAAVCAIEYRVRERIGVGCPVSELRPTIPTIGGQRQCRHCAATRVGKIYTALLSAILDHRLPPGARLPEDELGSLYGVSRTVVRAALQALAHERSSRSSRTAAPRSPSRRRRKPATSSRRAPSSSRASPRGPPDSPRPTTSRA